MALEVRDGFWLLKGHASARLHCAVHCFLCFPKLSHARISVDTCFHIHTAAASTWTHVSHVEKNAYPTPKQAHKTVAVAKRNVLLLQSCGNSKTATPTQREKAVLSFYRGRGGPPEPQKPHQPVFKQGRSRFPQTLDIRAYQPMFLCFYGTNLLTKTAVIS